MSQNPCGFPQPGDANVPQVQTIGSNDSRDKSYGPTFGSYLELGLIYCLTLSFYRVHIQPLIKSVKTLGDKKKKKRLQGSSRDCLCLW